MANIHLPFEEWVLSGESLNSEESRLLQEHLETCETCRTLSISWKDVHTELVRAPMRSPLPGFSRRWEARLAAERYRRDRKQGVTMFVLSAGFALMLIIALGLWVMPLLQAPRLFLLLWVYQLVTTFAYVTSIGSAIGTVAGKLYGLVPWTFWIALVVFSGSLGLLWIVIFRKLTSTRRVIT